MLIRGAAVLAGPELEHLPGADVRIRGGEFAEVAPRLEPEPGEESADCSGALLVPGFVNAHTHVGDSVAKDAAAGADADGRIHPVHGAKRRILRATPPGLLADLMRATCRLMLSGGTTTFADFREGGREGALLLRGAARDIPIRAVILGRLERYPGPAGGPLPPGAEAELGGLLGACDGLGISGANENSPEALARYSRTGKMVAIHAAETAGSVAASLEATGRPEVSRALEARPDFLVHMTHATPAEMRAASRTRGIVACPRANASLAAGIPDTEAMREAGCNVALGTDNVMVNQPDMFREMDFAWKASMGIRRRPADPREVLKMATVNGGRALGMRVGAVAPGMAADCVLLDAHSLELEPAHDPHAAVVHRASRSSVRAVLVGGRVAHGRL